MNVTELTVLYNGAIVGKLAEVERGVIAFKYSDFWIKNGFSISPFSLPLDEKIYVTDKTIFDGLYGVFWDTLPDGWGELLVKRTLAKRGINYDRLTPLTKLSIIGDKGLGGLAYEPATVTGEEGEATLDELAAEANKVLANSSADLDVLYRYGGASGGARPKAHVNIDGEEWIVKFPCAIDPVDVGVEEYEANETAARCGININEHRLFPSAVCKGYFGAKRFDRDGDKRIHVVSLSALLETTHRVPNLDYHHLMQVTKYLCVTEDMYEAFRRACYNVFYGNKDDHGKNFAFIYDETGGVYRLSPAFDVTKTDYKAEHEMTVNGNGNPTESDLMTLVARFDLNVPRCQDIMDKVKEECKR